MDREQADEAVNKDRAAARPAASGGFDEQVAALEKFIRFEPLIREIDYKILVYCATRRALGEVEEAIASWPEFAGATRDQYHLITELARHGGLEEVELDAGGHVVTDADKEGLTENEVDDLVVSLAFQTTAVGAAVAVRLDPARRFAELIEQTPARRDAYLALLGFLRAKRSFSEVDAFMRACDVAELARAAGDGGVQPSVFVDKLERAGVAFYDHGWQANEAGIAALEKLEAADRAEEGR